MPFVSSPEICDTDEASTIDEVATAESPRAEIARAEAAKSLIDLLVIE
ncbi:hypothetical protein HO404_10380 [Streptococcus suis]|nr:hypothetical protein [Streptococcus suis]